MRPEYLTPSSSKPANKMNRPAAINSQPTDLQMIPHRLAGSKVSDSGNEVLAMVRLLGRQFRSVWLWGDPQSRIENRESAELKVLKRAALPAEPHSRSAVSVGGSAIENRESRIGRAESAEASRTTCGASFTV